MSDYCELCGNFGESQVGNHILCSSCLEIYLKSGQTPERFFNGGIDDYQKEAAAEVEKQMKLMESAIAQESKKLKAISDILVTSCSHIEGYRIVEYCGYISCDAATSVSRGSSGFFGDHYTNVESEIIGSLSSIRKNAIQKLKEETYKLGCNAIIGIDLDYINLEPESANYKGGTTYLPYVFCVSANGTAVKIEKIEDYD